MSPSDGRLRGHKAPGSLERFLIDEIPEDDPPSLRSRFRAKILSMLTVADAQTLVLEHARPAPAETMPLTPSALGLVLAEDVTSDIDMPPWDKALMDGYAVRSADLPGGRGLLHVIEEVTAGQTPARIVEEGQATRIDNLPCLMITAEKDPVLSPAMAEGMPGMIGDLEMHMVRDSGHWTQQEKPDEVNRLILDWLAMLFANAILKWMGTALQVLAVVLGVTQIALGINVILQSLSLIGVLSIRAGWMTTSTRLTGSIPISSANTNRRRASHSLTGTWTSRASSSGISRSKNAG